jgi:hypothetical protein
MAGVKKPEEEPVFRKLLRRFQQVPVSAEVAERAVIIRQQIRMRLPDAIIRASAIRANLSL